MEDNGIQGTTPGTAGARSLVVFAHAQGMAPWNMLVFSKHGLGWGGVGC